MAIFSKLICKKNSGKQLKKWVFYVQNLNLNAQKNKIEHVFFRRKNILKLIVKLLNKYVLD